MISNSALPSPSKPFALRISARIRKTSRPVNGQLTVTIGKFYRVTGESTQHRGVEPDVALASPISLEEVGESSLDWLPAVGY